MTELLRSDRGLLRQLAPQFSIIAIMFTVTGIGLATIPLFIKNDLHLGATAVGVTSGAQFVAAIALRIKAGRYCDRKGSARALMVGLLWTLLGGALCGLAWMLRGHPITAAGVLLCGRIALGGGESYVMSGTQTWALALAGTARAAQVIGWVGTAMFTALALGAPLGGYLYQIMGFGGIGLVTALIALGMLIGSRRLRSPAIPVRAQPSLRGSIWRLRTETGCMALGGFSYGAMIAFSVVLFIERDWNPNWAALTAFSIALVASRLVAGGLPDRIGGAKAACVSLFVLAGGMIAMAQPGSVAMGLFGAALSGLGYAVVYPALTREAVQRVDPAARGTALALVSASIYLTLGLGNPLLGMMADRIGTASVFWFSGAMAIAAALILVLAGRQKV
ncbi:MFS transporter [Paracoccus sp. P2]|uniref:MFS transporter n=1 Tax=Paracoccus sp. P2 TaxID=3248840 RepID=UPI00391FAD21